MIKQEWSKLLRNRLLVISLIIIITIPTFYALLFLGSMWDPYGKVSNLPVAVVNQDHAVDYDGSTLNIGEEMVKSLKDDNSMKFDFVSEDVAKSGLENGDYYMVITIPENFSENCSTLMSDNPKKMVLDYETNPGKNFIASKMSESGMTKIKEGISDEVTSVYAKTIFKQFGQAGSGMKEAATATSDLLEGINKLHSGSMDLSDGLSTVSSSMLTFTDGVNSFSSGLEQYISGVKTVNDGASALAENAQKLADGTDSLNKAVESISIPGITLTSDQNKQIAETAGAGSAVYANQLSQGIGSAVSTSINSKFASPDISSTITGNLLQSADIQQLSQLLIMNGYSEDQVEQLLNGIVSAALNGAASQISEASITSSISPAVSDAMSKIVAGSATAGANAVIKQVNQSLSTYSGSFDLLKVSTQSLSNGANKLSLAAQKLSNGTNKLVSKNKSLLDGISLLSISSNEINDGVNKLYSGSFDLNDGLDKAADGSATLKSDLSDAAAKITDSMGNIDDSTIEMLAAPVEDNETQISSVANNGHAMAAYMMTVAIWLGCIAFCMVYPIKESCDKYKSGFRQWIAKASVIYPAAIIWTLFMIASLHAFLGFHPEHMRKTIIVSCVAAVTCMSIVYFFNVALEQLGTFIVLILMIVQLSGSQGTYPTELSAPFVAKITNFLPFTYIIRSFRSTISGGPKISGNLLVLLVLTAVLVLLTILYFIAVDKKQNHVETAGIENVIYGK